MADNSDNVKKQSTGRLDKSEGSYYTPRKTAAAILDIAGYKTDNSRILKSRIIDPSCGDGALLVEAAARFIEASLAEGLSPAKTARGIALKFHAYEIDAEELEKAKENVAAEAAEHGIPLSADELENFRAGDAFKLYKNSLGPFEYVVGNPPYVRIHNLSEKPESSYIEGMCDLFYPFFDIGQKLLAEDGVLCYIAPSSWFTARAGRLMRKDLQERSAISAVCDFGHYQVFAPYATAYTAIVRIEALPSKKIKVFPANAEDGHLGVPHLVRQSAAWVNGMFLPKAPEHISEILDATGNVRVMNGYATNLDSVFISKEPRFPGSRFERDVVKASKCEKHYMFYPYDEHGTLIGFDEIRRECPEAAALLESDKERLLARTQVDSGTWWQFGRSQGISDTFCDKVAIQTLVKPGQRVKVMSAPAGVGVYGGVYVVGMGERSVSRAVNSVEFLEYAAALRKYKSGGYYALGGKDIERFLNWWANRK